ncbi:MAG: hypothetical protein ACI4IQ_06040 [Eubacterium sp.]
MAKKEFKSGLYAVVAGIVVAVALVLITIFAFTTRYTAFSPEKVAQTYVDTIVQTGDGYNAYKNTLVSKNAKYGDFVYDAYILPYVNDGDDVKQADFVGTGSDEEAAALNTVYSTMYDYYLELLDTYGLDDYDSVYTNYFAKLAQLRKDVYGDDYIDRDFMFGAFEANVASYGASLTGTEEEIAQDGKTVLQEKTIGKYQEMYGEDYKLTSTVTQCTPLSEDEVTAYVEKYNEAISPMKDLGIQRADEFKLEDTSKEKKVLFFTKTENINTKSDFIGAYENLTCSDISAVDRCVVEVTLENGTVVTSQEVYVVQIGNSWYVDNTTINTSALYLAK